MSSVFLFVKPTHHEFCTRLEYNLDWTYSEAGLKYFQKRVTSDSAIVLVAEVEGNVVGYILAFINSYTFRKVNPIAEVENMFIDEEYRRSGIGSKLMAELKKIAKERGVRRLKVEAVAQNAKAINFYRSCGFETFETILEMKLD